MVFFGGGECVVKGKVKEKIMCLIHGRMDIDSYRNR